MSAVTRPGLTRRRPGFDSCFRTYPSLGWVTTWHNDRRKRRRAAFARFAAGRGGPVEIPAVLIGRLALAESLRGQGLGPVLLADALSRVLEATRTVAARLVVVEALHEQAAVFYERLGFTRLPGTLRLVQKLADVEAALQP